MFKSQHGQDVAELEGIRFAWFSLRLASKGKNKESHFRLMKHAQEKKSNIGQLVVHFETEFLSKLSTNIVRTFSQQWRDLTRTEPEFLMKMANPWLGQPCGNVIRFADR